MSKILVKYPTRQRPELFLKTLSGYIEKANNNADIWYLISYDSDDLTMTGEIISKALSLHENVICKSGISKSKIDACNRDVNEFFGQWDIILLVSDDMHVQQQGWDDTIRKDFEQMYPKYDGCLWYHDGSKQRVISTLSCIGFNFYNKFNYLYYPQYQSFFSDNEYTDVARMMGKIKFIDNVIIKHEHPQWGGGVKHDELYERNNGPWKHDQELYEKRKSLNFKI